MKEKAIRMQLSQFNRVVILLVLLIFCSGGYASVLPDWEAVNQMPGSKYFRSQISDMHLNKGYSHRHPWLREELLLVQTNSRVLVGQNPKGILRHVALPTQVYPVPNGPKQADGGLIYEPGVFYLFDLVQFSDLRYQIQMGGDPEPADVLDASKENETFYAQDFLPLTSGRRGDLDVSVFSFAPVADDSSSAALAPAPLPGPAGVIYILKLKNRSNAPVSARILLRCPDRLHGRKPVKTVSGATLILTALEGSVGIHMNNGSWEQDGDTNVSSRAIEIPAGGETVIETRVVLGANFKDIRPVLHELFLHSALDWLNYTVHYWQKRFGRLQVGAFEAQQKAEISRDIYIRSVLDNFACLQTDGKGNLISHYQGAAKGGGVWGIDYEPTLISIAPIFPELARQGILYTMERNRPPRRLYPDHSIPILVAPLLIARKWLELTGDISLFRERSDVMKRLESILKELQTVRAPKKALYSTKYSSDGPVGRKYDHGTNVKVWYAFDSYAYLLEALGRQIEAKVYHEEAAAIAAAIRAHMIVEGPFGPQFSGGTNLGKDPGVFYLPETHLYYDGEDSGSHLAPIYGIYDFRFQPWINYHRFARSMFCPNYEPELGALRWFPSGLCPVVDGTGFFSRLGGSVLLDEMKVSLNLLYENACDETGSVYWWPLGLNYKRGLTRCSQGQGSWAWQYLEQWLGLKVDVWKRTLILAPRGLLTDIHWSGCALGNSRFDIDWKERKSGVRLSIRNLNDDTWTIRVGLRPWGSGAAGELSWKQLVVEPGAKQSLRLSNVGLSPLLQRGGDPVPRAEAEQFSDNGIVLKRYGPISPLPEGLNIWEEDLLDLRFYVLNASAEDWSDASVTLSYPDNWKACSRKAGYWPRPGELVPNQVNLQLGPVASLEHRVAPFQLQGPHDYEVVRLDDGKSRHFPCEEGNLVQLPTPDVEVEQQVSFEAVLTVVRNHGKEERHRLVVPVKIIPIRTN